MLVHLGAPRTAYSSTVSTYTNAYHYNCDLHICKHFNFARPLSCKQQVWCREKGTPVACLPPCPVAKRLPHDLPLMM